MVDFTNDEIEGIVELYFISQISFDAKNTEVEKSLIDLFRAKQELFRKLFKKIIDVENELNNDKASR